jgi:hypothetical protein
MCGSRVGIHLFWIFIASFSCSVLAEEVPSLIGHGRIEPEVAIALEALDRKPDMLESLSSPSLVVTASVNQPVVTEDETVDCDATDLRCDTLPPSQTTLGGSKDCFRGSPSFWEVGVELAGWRRADKYTWTLETSSGDQDYQPSSGINLGGEVRVAQFAESKSAEQIGGEVRWH